jgi:hypothetical protein
VADALPILAEVLYELDSILEALSSEEEELAHTLRRVVHQAHLEATKDTMSRQESDAVNAGIDDYLIVARLVLADRKALEEKHRDELETLSVIGKAAIQYTRREIANAGRTELDIAMEVANLSAPSRPPKEVWNQLSSKRRHHYSRLGEYIALQLATARREAEEKYNLQCAGTKSRLEEIQRLQKSLALAADRHEAMAQSIETQLATARQETAEECATIADMSQVDKAENDEDSAFNEGCRESARAIRARFGGEK